MAARGPKSDKLWADAVRLAVMRESDTPGDDGKKRKRLSAIADKLARLAEDGDMGAIKEVGDRLDGKPAQAIVGDNENPLTVIQRIERVVVSPTDTDG